jgi:hypothetical protein
MQSFSKKATGLKEAGLSIASMRAATIFLKSPDCIAAMIFFTSLM